MPVWQTEARAAESAEADKYGRATFQGHDYLMVKEKMTWENAEAFCEQLGGHLVTITTKEEYEFARKLQLSNGHIWIGFTDKEKEGDWKWVTGEAATFTNWYRGQPDNSVGGWGGAPQNYCLMESNGLWDDREASATYSFICEWEGHYYDYSSSYGFIVTDSSGQPIQGAEVDWYPTGSTDDGAEKGITDADGQVWFDKLTIGQPIIRVSCDGYLSYTNEGTNYQKSEKGYDVIVLYTKSENKLKLRYANFMGNLQLVDLLSSVKTLTLDNQEEIFLDGKGGFGLNCWAIDPDSVQIYQLWQNNKLIAKSETGEFALTVEAGFCSGGNCFVRVISKDGKAVDTPINLTFTENTVNEATEVSIGRKIKIEIGDDDIPFLGGSTVEFGDALPLGLDVHFSDGKIYIGYNSKDLWGEDDDKGKGKFDKLKEEIAKAKKANVQLGSSNKEALKKFVKEDKDFELPTVGKVEMTIVGYAEGDINSKTAKGELYIACTARTPVAGWTTWVVVVPVTVRIYGQLDLQAGAKISYDWGNATFNGTIPVEIEMAIKAFGGIGVGKCVGVGVYL